MLDRTNAKALLLLLVVTGCATRPETGAYERLLDGFRNPPAEARPDAFWPWLNGHADQARITEEMEEFQAAGFSRLQVWDVKAHRDPDGFVPIGPAFLSDEWLENLAHANREAQRLGLELGLLAASGWNAGGTWVEPEQAGLGLYSSVQGARGPATLDLELAFPEVPDHCPRAEDGRPAYWRTVAVQASPAADAEALVPEHVVDLTERIDDEGRLRWDAPAGDWTIRWFVFANTGQRLIVPSPNSDGLQIDFFDADDSRAYFTYVLDRLESALGPLEDTALRYLEVDSLELEGKRLCAWTEEILESFAARYGYDARPWLSLLTDPERAGERGGRFLHDWTRHVSDLMIENHYRLGDRFLRERGLLLAAEAGGPGPPIWNSCPVDALGALGAVGLLRGEFWPKQRSMYNVKEIACAAHTYGRTIVDAESFTCWRHWRDSPYYLKLLADQAFVDGLNHITFHTAPHGGAEKGLPGYAYHAGTHMGPNLVWWTMARPFIDYLSRCSFLLQEGISVADVCFYQGDGAPAFHPLAVDWDPELRRAGYDYDLVDVRVLTSSMSVEDGRIVLPHGVSYAVLVLPDEESIDPAALRQVRELVRAGATVLGPRPLRANGLAIDPGGDDEVRALADELWGEIDGARVTEHRFGKGRVVSGPGSVLEVLDEVPPDFSWIGGDRRTRLNYVHRSAGDVEVYFVINDHERLEELEGLFRVTGKRPELWDPSSGEVVRPRTYHDDGTRTRVRLRLPPGGSTFVVFRSDPTAPEPISYTVAPVPRARSTTPDLAHGDAPNGPAWMSSGKGPPDGEFIVYDLGATVDLGHADVWNFQDQARGLLTRGIREMTVSVSPDGEAFEPLGQFELRRAPDIGERGYEQRFSLSAARTRYVRFDVVSNHGDDWSGWTDFVGLNRVVFFGADGAEVEGVRVYEVSSGLAHDPRTDELRAPVEEGFELPGPWRVLFAAGRGAPEEAQFTELISWADSDDEGIRHFSGIAEYIVRFTPPAELLEPGASLQLDLGRVAGVARVHLNGVELGVAWKPPYAVDVGDWLRPGENEVRCEVANTWHNRLVGDSRRPPDERITRTNIRGPFGPETPLLESGILGPVRLVPVEQAPGRRATPQVSPAFEPNWDSLEGYRCPEWFRDAKFGIFLHYGLNTVPGFDGHYARHMYWQEKPEPVKGTGWTEGSPKVYQHHVETYGHPTEFGYKDFLPLWKAEKFDAPALAAYFESIGAKYVVPVAVHCDNFDNWNSVHHRWNSVEKGPGIDFVGEWKKACREHGLYFGVSSHFNDGHEAVFFQGGADTTGPLAGVPYDTQDPRYLDFYHERTPDRRKILPEFAARFLERHLQLVDTYQPDLLYFDGGLPYGEAGLQVGARFLNMNLERHDGTENGVLNLKRGFPKGAATLDIEKGQADRLFEEPWQTDTTINPGWFFLGDVEDPGVVDGDLSSRQDDDQKRVGGSGLRMDAGQIVDNLVDIVAKNGNLLLNVGQREDGSIPQVYRDELEQVGRWLEINGEAIYGTRPWVEYGEGPTQIETGYDTEPLDPWSERDIRFTTKGEVLYVIPLAWPKEGSLTVKSLSSEEPELGEIRSIRLLGYDGELKWKRDGEGLTIEMPEQEVGRFAPVFRVMVK